MSSQLPIHMIHPPALLWKNGWLPTVDLGRALHDPQPWECFVPAFVLALRCLACVNLVGNGFVSVYLIFTLQNICRPVPILIRSVVNFKRLGCLFCFVFIPIVARFLALARAFNEGGQMFLAYTLLRHFGQRH